LSIGREEIIEPNGAGIGSRHRDNFTGAGFRLKEGKKYKKVGYRPHTPPPFKITFYCIFES
jgi:hypothetical protein